jgi:hypothetical protein
MSEEIKVIIKKDGSLEYDVKGVKGRSCKALTKAIDDIAGGQVLDTKTTGEFCEEEREHVKN